ncbi:hypothetical protein GOC60_17025 [Sinorhizobium meliloti]|nr:hypothetical protein [Sinorhizobium meliloti]MDX0350167.1 hypothetical protein [Sinorhizobium meliloti]
MGSKKPKQSVTLYYMAQHFGIAHGPLDFIAEIFVNEKSAWKGRQSGQGDIEIHKENLFGGQKKEGGVEGVVHYLPGGPNQTIPENIASKHGRTTATMPAYRGIASAFFHWPSGGGNRGGEGFYWSANSPYLPPVWIKAARSSLPLGEEFARIWRGEERETRKVTNNYGNWRTFDVHESTIAHASAGRTHIIIEDLRTGTVRAAIPVSYTPYFVYICRARQQVLALDLTGTLHAYNLADGAAAGSVPLGIPANPTDNQTGGAPAEIVVDGVTYLFFQIPTQIPAVVCCKNSGSGWEFLWQDAGDWGVTGYQAIIAPSPDYLVMRFGGYPTVCRVPWSREPGGGLGNVVWVNNYPALLGLSGSITDYAINSVTYLPASGNWLLTMIRGPVAIMNHDFTAVVAQADTGEESGSPHQQPVKSRTITAGQGTAAFFTEGDVYFFDLATLELVDTIPESEWKTNYGTEVDAGYSETEHAFVVFDVDGAAEVLFFPRDTFDSNPAHIIYECLVNTDWGMGSPPTAIDIASFEAAAEVLYAERFGLSMIWTQQSTIESFVSEVLDHIEAVLFVNPRNGLLTLKLIRNDYDVDALPVFTPDNSSVTKFARKLWGETINEIVVTFTNPANEEEETVTAQDLANIEAQGGIVSDGRNYYGVRVKALATRLAHRDLRAASTPLASCDIEANRAAWNLLPGDCLKLHSPDDGIDKIVMRVGPVDYGKPGESTIRASLVEDIFSLPLADYELPPDTAWQPVSETPSPADYTLAFTLPYYLVVNEVDQTVLNAGWEYPETFAGVLAAEAGQDTAEFELFEADGDDLGTKTIVSRAELAADIPAEPLTVLPTFPFRTQGNPPTVGGLVLIEGADDAASEICAITGEYPAGYTVERGVLDTVPRAWPAGTPVWFLDANHENTDDTVRSEAETVLYRVLPRTSLGLLDANAAPVISETLSARPHLPLRPANVRVGGDPGFAGAVDQDGVDPIPVTWSRRNRLTEDTVIVPWDAADVTPEAGQTTRIEILDLGGAVLALHDDIAGTAFDVPLASFAGNSRGNVRVSAKRDDLISLQAHEIEVIVATGYGYGYGYNYGGA